MTRPRPPGRGMPLEPTTPLHAYSPGELAKLTPEQRGRALKHRKNVRPGAALMTPHTILSGRSL
jgi:hypothetical protein